MSRSILFDKFWLKLLLSVLIFFSTVFLIAYPLFMKNTCTEFMSCYELQVVFVAIGVLVLSLPLVLMLFLWEYVKKYRQTHENKYK